jgi:hypothetical protein
VVAALSRVSSAVTTWRPTPPPLPEYLALRRPAAAITRGPVPLRAGQLDRPAHVDPTRPTTAVAAYPGGVVPEDIP